MDDSSGCNPSKSSSDQHRRIGPPFPGYLTPPFPTNIPPQFIQQVQHHFSPNLNKFSPNLNPYGMHPYHPYGTFEANFNFSPSAVFGRGVGSEGGQSSSPVEFMTFPNVVVGSSPASPISLAPQTYDNVNTQIWSDNSDEEKKGRMNWIEKEDLKLVGAWLRNSVDPVKGNAQEGNDLWKKIVAEFNSNMTPDQKRLVSRCKTHYTKTNKLIVHFNGCWIRMKRSHGSGESDDQILAQAHEVYKREAKENHSCWSIGGKLR